MEEVLRLRMKNWLSEQKHYSVVIIPEKLQIKFYKQQKKNYNCVLNTHYSLGPF